MQVRRNSLSSLMKVLTWQPSPPAAQRHLPGVDRGKTATHTSSSSSPVREIQGLQEDPEPVWDFRCEFDYEPGEVKISVYDWNLVMGRKLRAWLPWMPGPAGPAAERWHKLEGSVSGEALVTVRRAREGKRRPRQVRPRRPSPWTGARSAGGSSEALGMI